MTKKDLSLSRIHFLRLGSKIASGHFRLLKSNYGERL